MVIWPWRRPRVKSEPHVHSADAPQWVEIGSYAGHFDADIDRALLETADIPVLVKGASTGVFGPGFAGPTAEGVRLFVPGSLLERAREVLAGEADDE